MLWSCFIAPTGNCDTEPITSVVIEPLKGAVSFSTVTVDNAWETMPSVALRGRKEVRIFNTSDTYNVYLSSETDNTVQMGTLYPRQGVTFKASSDLLIYASANTAAIVHITEMR